ncbi:hypothetical protein LSCM1_07497 [Leishmania martiniquensis]|uniref:Uncharacterized protein n=1 Tax=Leishmania martiniquensis TaxID=1580590 RepID=A0A836I375_9TRYP|nr:hypothetical protein LSCM1_07497 [Leishmania martiniquensis]
MSDASASPPTSPSPVPSAELTLRDYVVHQRVLKQLLRSQPVWLLDDVLGLRYRARLQLRLLPHPQLHFTDDAADNLYFSGPRRESCGDHDAAEHGGSGCEAPEVDAAYPVVPLTPSCSIELLPEVGEAGVSCLRICVAPAAACGPAASADSVTFLIIPASTEAVLVHMSAWVAVLRRLCRLPTAPQRAAGVVKAVGGMRSYQEAQPAPSHVDPAPTEQSRAAAPSAANEGGGGTSPIAKPTSSPCRGYISSPSSAQAHLVSSSEHVLAGAILDRDVEEDRRQLELLTEALRARTREAAELKAQLQRVIAATQSRACSPLGLAAPNMAPAAESSAAANTAAVAAREEVERPPTMAHVSSGLVPALPAFPPPLTGMSSGDDDDDESSHNDDEVAAGCAARNNFRDDADGAPFALSEDSARPQAPRSGHVCNLGCLGPKCGDEDALRMYKEIRGGHSSSSSSGNRSSASSPSSAASASQPRPAA